MACRPALKYANGPLPPIETQCPTLHEISHGLSIHMLHFPCFHAALYLKEFSALPVAIPWNIQLRFVGHWMLELPEIRRFAAEWGQRCEYTHLRVLCAPLVNRRGFLNFHRAGRPLR